MKDKHGNELPGMKLPRPAKHSDTKYGRESIFYDTGPKHRLEPWTCTNCKRVSRGESYTARTIDNRNLKEPFRPRTYMQGPLCPACSEIPHNKLPPQDYMELPL